MSVKGKDEGGVERSTDEATAARNASAYDGNDKHVQVYRLDDIFFPVDVRHIWFLNINAEGKELNVLQGARHLIKDARITFVAFRFSAHGRKGSAWGVLLLEEMERQGYECYHLRGFGQCHDVKHRPGTSPCNYPFSMRSRELAPTFEQYVRVFQSAKEQKGARLRTSDMVCKRKS